MSQDQQKPRKSQPSVTQASPSKQSWFRSLTLWLLRGTIQSLEVVVERLEEPSDVAGQPPRRRYRVRKGRAFIAGLIALALSVGLFLFSSKVLVPKVVEIASKFKPAPEVTSPEVEPSPEPSIAPTPEATPTPAPTPEASPTPEPEPTLTPEPIPEPTPEVSPSPEPTPEVVAEPEIELTPEQRLIASIQAQITEISNQYVSELINVTQPKFRSSRLIVQVSDRWYSLAPKLQDQLANELLARSQQLDFSKLELTNAQGTLLARNPVVGSSMIILKRKNYSPTPTYP
jgi:hypothetical protein